MSTGLSQRAVGESPLESALSAHPQWRALLQHQREAGSRYLRDLFAEDMLHREPGFEIPVLN